MLLMRRPKTKVNPAGEEDGRLLSFSLLLPPGVGATPQQQQE